MLGEETDQGRAEVVAIWRVACFVAGAVVTPLAILESYDYSDAIPTSAPHVVTLLLGGVMLLQRRNVALRYAAVGGVLGTVLCAAYLMFLFSMPIPEGFD